MMDIGEIKGAVKIENGIMVLTLAEQERMKLIRRLAVSGEAYVDSKGNMDIHFDLRGSMGSNNEEEESVEEEPTSATSDFDALLEEIAKEERKESKQADIINVYQDLVEIEGEKGPRVDFDNVVDINEDAGSRSIDELTPEEMEYLVGLYINDVPTKIIMSSENVTKSALYSSLERERIPRKGKLNTIIRRLEDGDNPVEISSEEDIDISVINRIITTLK